MDFRRLLCVKRYRETDGKEQEEGKEQDRIVDSYDFSGRQIILFATSGGSGFGKTKDDLKVSISKLATIIEAGLLNGKHTKESLILHNARIYRTALVKRILLALCSQVTRKF